jgi:hypothetical protein
MPQVIDDVRGPIMGRFPTWTKISVVAAAVLLSPVFAFAMAIAVEILIGAVKDAGGLKLLLLIVAGAFACSLLHKRFGRRGVALRS